MRVEVIAEIGQGFEGSIAQAKLLVLAAAKAGADSAKFQLVYADELATPDYEYYQLFSQLEMSDDDWSDVKSLCDHHGIELIFDVFGEQGLRLANKIGVSSIKLHATDINNYGFLKLLDRSSVSRILVGTGGAFLEEIKAALEILKSKEVILLHGFQGYPTAIEDNQVTRIEMLKEHFAASKNVSFGLSDHVDPSDPMVMALPAYAIGKGATVVEKHLTLGSCMELEDYESALNPDQFKIFSEVVRKIELAAGFVDNANDFGMPETEKTYRRIIRRHVVAKNDLPAGTIITQSDVILKRTSSSEHIAEITSVYDKKTRSKVTKNTPLKQVDIE